MAAQIIDGKAVSAKVKEEVRQEIEREGLDVGLAVVIVGDDPASRVYVNNKKKACEVCGIKTQTELSAYLGIRQSSISDAKRRMMIPAAWLLTLLTREGVNPAWVLTGGGSKFLVPASLPPSAPTLLLARLAGPELEQRIRAGLMSVTECIAEEIRALAEGKEEKGE